MLLYTNFHILIIVTYLIAFIFVHIFIFLMVNLEDQHIGLCIYLFMKRIDE